MRYLQQTATEEKVKLDVKDRKILSFLAQDARTPHSIIAKKVALSRDAVAYRVQNYEKKGLIQGYRTMIDISLFGYEAYHLFLQLNRPTAELEKKLIEKFQAFPFMRAVIRFSGKYDFELAVVAKGIRDFDRILDEIINFCAPYLQDYKVVITAQTFIGRVFPKNFYEIPEKKVSSKRMPAIIDEKDKEILIQLADNAVLSYQELAKKTKLSPDTVAYRVRKLLDAGIILRFVPVINYAALSYSVYAVLFRISGLDEKKKMILKHFLHEQLHILWAVKCVGRYNLLTYVCVQNTDDLNKTITSVRTHLPDTIIEYEIMVANEEYKYTYFPDYVVL